MKRNKIYLDDELINEMEFADIRISKDTIKKLLENLWQAQQIMEMLDKEKILEEDPDSPPEEPFIELLKPALFLFHDVLTNFRFFTLEERKEKGADFRPAGRAG